MISERGNRESLLRNSLRGKRILFISPRFFGYEHIITSRLSALGASVTFWDERPSNTTAAKALLRLMPGAASGWTRSYYENLLAPLPGDLDLVLLLKMECMDANFLRRLRDALPRAKFVYYTWDSMRNHANALKALPMFDEAFSFDIQDCSRIPKLKHRPLFFSDDYRADAPLKPAYGACFVGTAHSHRYAAIKRIERLLKTLGVDLRLFLYLPSRAIFWWRKILTPRFWGASRSEFSFVPLKTKEVVSIINQSRSVIDIQHPGQTGLTMRTLEVLGAKKKLITTNTQIRDYDFFREENTAVIDPFNPRIDRSFFESSYQELPPALYEKYSIDGWLAEVLGCSSGQPG